MKLSQALRRAAEHVLSGGNRWIMFDSDESWRERAKFCYQHMGSILVLTTMSDSEVCMALLLLAEIAEDGGM
jgi:hypothetical protein